MIHVFLGITVVGIVMTMKVIIDGLHEIGEITERITALRASTRNCLEQVEDEGRKAQDIETEVQQIKTAVEELDRKEKEMNATIRSLRADLDGQKSKIDK